MPPRILHPHQAAAKEMLRDSLRSGKRRPILMAPTGYGKTVLAGDIIKSAVAKGKRVCFVVDAVSLIDQSVNSFYRDGITEVGVIQADHQLTDWSKPVQVASIQTITKRGYPQADLVLVDECHCMYKTQTEWMRHPDWKDVPFIGFSATPWTKGLGKHWDDLIISTTTNDLIENGLLCKYRQFSFDHPDLSKVKMVDGDYNGSQLSAIMEHPKLVANVVQTWIVHGENRPTLCFAVDCSHAKRIQREFEMAGIPTGYIDAYTDNDDRNIIAAKFKRGEYPVVCNVGTLIKGVDWDVRCIIMARPTRSEMRYVQMIGRGLRTADGKEDLVILDHSDTWATLGYASDIHYDTLDDGNPKSSQQGKRYKVPKECSKCHYLRPVGVRECPACGHMADIPPGAKHDEGQLSEIIRGKGTKATGPRNSIRMGDKWIPLGEFYGQLLLYASNHGFKHGWSANKYKEAVGTWPNLYRDAPHCAISREVSSWIKSRNIAWAKRND